MALCLNCEQEFSAKGSVSCSPKCAQEYIQKLEKLNGPILEFAK